MRLARVGFWLLEWVFAAAIWMLLVDTSKLPEVAAGAFVATVAATWMELVRGQRIARLSIHPGFIAPAWRPLLGAVRDIGRLTLAVLRQLVEREPVRGRVVAIPFAHGADEPRDNGRRAAAQALGSLAPNTIVIGVDPDGDRLIAHQLVLTGAPEDLDPLHLR